MLIATTARIYPPEMDTTERLERTAAAGFDGIELNLELTLCSAHAGR